MRLGGIRNEFKNKTALGSSKCRGLMLNYWWVLKSEAIDVGMAQSSN